MITKPTVLILGAGASMPYGFPSGQELYHKICSFKDSAPEILQYLSSFNFSPAKLTEFCNALYKSGTKSVDGFLEHRPEFLEIGKACIALALIPYEIEESLFDRAIENRNWYKYLFEKLNAPFEGFEKNRLSIITYNYDRSLEHFLITSLINLYGKTIKECRSKLARIPIIYLHGRLGCLFWPKEQCSSYQPTLNPKRIKTASESIKIVYENSIGDDDFRSVHELLKEARFIYFLGFGYNETNLKRLNLPSLDRSSKLIFGSSHGHTRMEISAIHKKYQIDLCRGGYEILKCIRENLKLE